jgi:excisionase family DNA binding protein
MDKLYSIEDAAKQLGGISKFTIERWLSSGKLRRTKVGRRTMVRGSELMRVICDAPITIAKNDPAKITEGAQPQLQSAA